MEVAAPAKDVRLARARLLLGEKPTDKVSPPAASVLDVQKRITLFEGGADLRDLIDQERTVPLDRAFFARPGDQRVLAFFGRQAVDLCKGRFGIGLAPGVSRGL